MVDVGSTAKSFRPRCSSPEHLGLLFRIGFGVFGFGLVLVFDLVIDSTCHQEGTRGSVLSCVIWGIKEGSNPLSSWNAPKGLLRMKSIRPVASPFEE